MRKRNNTRMNEAGVIAGADALLFGVLIFVFGTLLVVNAWSVVATKITAEAAAREAARTYVEAPDEQTARRSAQVAADKTVGAPTVVTIVSSNGGFRRCAVITARVTIRAGRIAVPFLGDHGSARYVHGSHTEIIDPYRSGLATGSAC